MIEQFDIYVRTDTGFICTKDHLIAHCYNRYGSKRGFQVAIYRNGQKTKQCVAYAGTSTAQWCREKALKQMDRIIAKDKKTRTEAA